MSRLGLYTPAAGALTFWAGVFDAPALRHKQLAHARRGVPLTTSRDSIARSTLWVVTLQIILGQYSGYSSNRKLPRARECQRRWDSMRRQGQISELQVRSIECIATVHTECRGT